VADIRDGYGNVICRREGNRILETYGNWKYTIETALSTLTVIGSIQFKAIALWIHTATECGI
jgi:hypothetical protein